MSEKDTQINELDKLRIKCAILECRAMEVEYNRLKKVADDTIGEVFGKYQLRMGTDAIDIETGKITHGAPASEGAKE